MLYQSTVHVGGLKRPLSEQHMIPRDSSRVLSITSSGHARVELNSCRQEYMCFTCIYV